MNDFLKAVNNTLNNDIKCNKSVTENGAIGYRTSGKNLLDLNFMVSSLRSATDEKIIESFKKAFFDDKELALKWLFYARDIRGGLGEKRIFRVVMNWFANEYPEYIEKVIPLISEYGRYDDLLYLIFDKDGDLYPKNKVLKQIKSVILKQLKTDISNYKQNKPISLLAKWLPSVNATSVKTKKMGKCMASMLGLDERRYRKLLSTLRKYIDVVETKMCNKEWESIKYENVPSRANLIYNNAF